MTETPEGFLICLSVPIARTGTQEYLSSEVGVEGDGMVRVTRLESDVFDRAAMASFEGKPVTLEHPYNAVEPGNATAYIKGHVQNVRRGTDDESDLLLADLFVTDPELIRKIRDDEMREVSCGYECSYTLGGKDSEGICQKTIRGNHVAVVSAGRAGERVAIKDQMPADKPEIKKSGGSSIMGKMSKSKIPLKHRLFATWAKDQEPEDIAEAVEEMVEEAVAEAVAEAESDMETTTDETPPAVIADQPTLEGLSNKIDALIEVVNTLTAAKSADEDLDPLEELAEALAEGGEESVTVEPEEIAEMLAEEYEETEDETVSAEMEAHAKENSPKGTSDSNAAARAAITALKPVIAGIKNPEDRKRASDAAVKQVRALMGKPVKPTRDGYANIARAKRQQQVVDARSKRAGELGANIMAKYNPHYKKGGN
jgi:hypothetical protein